MQKYGNFIIIHIFIFYIVGKCEEHVLYYILYRFVTVS